MPDYHHDLLFGSFITPVNAAPQQAVTLAAVSEAAGLDLATFQDHPYQPKFLDTWTLLSYVAGKTSRIHLSANVLNLPLRPPAVTARAAASLDLLSGGRFHLGLGAGAVWDAIESMGGPRLTAAQSVQALSEGIDIIRGIWGAHNDTPLTVHGTYHRVDDAERGPVPDHDIEIWLGASKPKMLRLIGTKADGWLPTLPYLSQDQLTIGNRIIDRTATEAGRDPKQIRRLLNIAGRFTTQASGEFLVGPSTQWVDQLLPLAVEQGFSTFILMSDDPTDLERFAAEVAPALREALAAERSAPDATQRTTPNIDVGTHRRTGIDYDAIPHPLTEAAVKPGDAEYPQLRSTHVRSGSPGLVLRPATPTEVADALAYARTQPVDLSIRSGGHGISGRSTNHGGIIIDLAALNTIEVIDTTTRRVRIGPGARWSDVAAALAPHGWGLSSGDHGGVGVGGLATAGGIGWLVRKHGLTIDHLHAVDMILADGSPVRASHTDNPDLFWAVRGAGGNFGIITAFEFDVNEVGDIAYAQFVVDATDTASFLHRWSIAIETAPRDVTSFLTIGKPRPGQPLIAHITTVVDSDNADTITNPLRPIAAAAPLLHSTINVLPYAAIMNTPATPQHAQGEPITRSALADHITPALATAAADLIHSGEPHLFQIRSIGGATADVPAHATAYAGRSANFQLVAAGTSRSNLNKYWDTLHPHFAGIYINFETDQRPERLTDAYPPNTLQRLRSLKQRYDPDNVFRNNFNITPEPNDPPPTKTRH